MTKTNNNNKAFLNDVFDKYIDSKKYYIFIMGVGGSGPKFIDIIESLYYKPGTEANEEKEKDFVLITLKDKNALIVAANKNSMTHKELYNLIYNDRPFDKETDIHTFVFPGEDNYDQNIAAKAAENIVKKYIGKKIIQRRKRVKEWNKFLKNNKGFLDKHFIQS